MPETTTTQYRLLMAGGGERVMTLPSDWIITFGPNVPGEGRGVRQYGEIRGWCFRVYSRSPKMLKACIPAVVEFYEEGSFDFEMIQRDAETNLVLGRATMDEILGRVSNRVSLARRRPYPNPQMQQAMFSFSPNQEMPTATRIQGDSHVSENLASAEQEQGDGSGF